MSIEDFCKHSRASASMISAESSCGCVFFGLCRFFLRAGSDGEGMLASEARSCSCGGGASSMLASGNCDLVGAFSVSVCLSTSEVCEDSGIAS